MRFQDEKFSALRADIDFSIGQYWRSFLNCAQLLFPQLLSRHHVEGYHSRSVFNLIDPVAIDDRRGEAAQETFEFPFKCLDLAFLRSIDGGDHTHVAGVEILVAVRNDDSVAHHGDAGIDASFRDDDAPYFFARLRFHRVDASIADPADQQSLTTDCRDQGSAVRGVIRPSAGGRGPDDLAGFLVHRDEAMRAVRHGAPRGYRRTDNHQIAIDQRRHGAAPMRGERAELFAHGSVPQFFSVLR